VGAGYFRTLGIPLLAGREFTHADAGPRPTVAVVNEAFAQKFNLGADAIGRRVAFGQGDGVRPDIGIVGIVRDAAYSSSRDQAVPQLFLSYRQTDASALTVWFYVRSAADASSLLTSARAAVAAIDPKLPVEQLRTMNDQIDNAARTDRFLAALAAAFAGLATVLAAVGLHAVVAYVVARRWREFGIRLALGATTGAIRRAVFAGVGRIAVAGAMIGGAGALIFGRLGQTFLFGLEDPGQHLLILVGAMALALAVAAAAAIVPVRRAGAVNPIEALRAE